MPSKLEITASLNKPSYSKQEVTHLVNSVSENKARWNPKIIKRGDVFGVAMGNKIRPVVAFKVVGQVVYAIPLTTTNNEMVLCESAGSRFAIVEEGHGEYFSHGVICSTVEFAKNNFLWVYDNNKALSTAIKQLKLTLRKVVGKL